MRIFFVCVHRARLGLYAGLRFQFVGDQYKNEALPICVNMQWQVSTRFRPCHGR